jgi:hypothetical protein
MWTFLIDISRFQWAYLQATYFLSLERLNAIRQRLESLPRDLKNAYDEIFQRILSSDDSAQIACRAFQWLMCTDYISNRVLLGAVCQDPKQNEVQPVDINVDFVLSACQNLLIFDKDYDRLRFSHLSVREYLERNHWNFSQANALAAKACISALKDSRCWSRAIRDADQDFLSYTRWTWFTHVQRHEEDDIDPVVSTLLREFLGAPNSSTQAYRAWLEKTLSGESYHFYRRRELKPDTTTSFAICFFGFYKVIGDWWDREYWDPNQTNSEQHSLLAVAAIGESPRLSSILKKLLSFGANVNMNFGTGCGSALAAAAYGGRVDAVKLLLDAGADPHVTFGGYYGSALAAAAKRGDPSSVKLLLESGVDVNMKLGEKLGSALTAAIWGGSADVVRLLFEAGADIHMPGGRSGSPYRAVMISDITGGVWEIWKLFVEANKKTQVQSGVTVAFLEAEGSSQS